jgi:anti-anti-sigma factor
MEVSGIATVYNAAHAAWVVRLGGDHDAQTAARLGYEFGRVIQPGCRVVVDLTEARFVDSSTINAILGARAGAQEVEGVLVVAATPDTTPRRVLDLLRVPAWFAGYETVDSALASLDGEAPEEPDGRRARFRLHG